MAKLSDESSEQTLPSYQSGNRAVGDIVVNRYQILSNLGNGGMGTVHKVLDKNSGEIQALKMLSSEVLHDPVQVQRFKQEADVLSLMRHPCLVDVRNFGVSTSGQPYFAMEYVQGETLATRLQRCGTLPIDEVKHLVKLLCDGLKEAHSHGVVHRDLKPSNIMFVEDGSGNGGDIKILDFGIAKMLNDQSTHVTRTGEVFGSPPYMSPEQCRGLTVDCRSDIYSLGCVVFEALTATPPHRGNNAVQTMLLHENEPAPSLAEASLGEAFPDNWEKLVARALSKLPEERYQSIEELEFDLRRLDNTEESASALPKDSNFRPERKQSSLVLKFMASWVGLLLLACLLAACLKFAHLGF